MGARSDRTARAIQAGLLACLLPGAGHFWLRQRGIGLVFFAAISLPYWSGAAIGGVKENINPVANRWLFIAELPVLSYTLIGMAASRSLPTVPPTQYSPYVSYYPESDVAQIYLATAGLLNVLAILDAIARAQTDGKPVFEHELAAAEAARTGGGT